MRVNENSENMSSRLIMVALIGALACGINGDRSYSRKLFEGGLVFPDDNTYSTQIPTTDADGCMDNPLELLNDGQDVNLVSAIDQSNSNGFNFVPVIDQSGLNHFGC
ncbi:PREDICTED: uncharacterized protein LOC109211252 [Nicotiana attenuata]|uniref:Uncharacterized protein n=1 Tax=Nicotiana attenuata TaxID=49451 RepID=A0A314KJU1_NICAT|nr:PREDICTED: uncharacterized protein LOC109211252 [Nicotiana attenuata]OIT29510.1 hypothetical protein A4A49_28859 [Nicotiana attenuata]